MKTIQVDNNKNLVFKEMPDPVIKDEEILIRVKAAGVNRADLMQRNGEYPSPAGWPEWPGLEVAGYIEDMGKTAAENSNFKKGDPVCALMGGGGYSSLAAVPYETVFLAPKGFEPEKAVCIPEVYTTAYLNLFLEGKLKSGETLFVFAGASGVGIAAIQIAKVYGCTVYASVRSDIKKDAVLSCGADEAINTRTDSITEFFDNHKIDVVLDCVGGPDMGKCFGKLNFMGRWVTIAALAGEMTEINLKTLYVKRLKLAGSTLRSRPDDEKHEILTALTKYLYPYFENGSIEPVIYKTLPFEQAEEAHSILASDRNIGKVILTF